MRLSSTSRRSWPTWPRGERHKPHRWQCTEVACSITGGQEVACAQHGHVGIWGELKGQITGSVLSELGSTGGAAVAFCLAPNKALPVIDAQVRSLLYFAWPEAI